MDIAETQNKITNVSTKIEALEEDIKANVAAIEKAQKTIKQTNQAVADATEQRKKEAQLFTSQMAENNTAVGLIEKAKMKLNQFYNPQLVAPTEGPQMTEEERLAGSTTPPPATEEPQIVASSGAAAGQGGKATAVIALMDKLIGECKTAMQAMEHTEKTSNEDYAEMMKASKSQVEDLGKEISQQKAEKASSEGELATDKETLAGENSKLDVLNQQTAELKNLCDEFLANFTKTQDALHAKIDSMKSAIATLRGAK